MLPGVQLDTKLGECIISIKRRRDCRPDGIFSVPPDIRQQFAHHAGTFVLGLHLLYLKVFQEICDHRIQRDGKNHDGDPHERGPSEKVVQRDERERDLFETSGQG